MSFLPRHVYYTHHFVSDFSALVRHHHETTAVQQQNKKKMTLFSQAENSSKKSWVTSVEKPEKQEVVLSWQDEIVQILHDPFLEMPHCFSSLAPTVLVPKLWKQNECIPLMLIYNNLLKFWKNSMIMALDHMLMISVRNKNWQLEIMSEKNPMKNPSNDIEI